MWSCGCLECAYPCRPPTETNVNNVTNGTQVTVTRDARGHKVGGVVCTLGTMTDWLSVPEFAARLGLRDSDVRELLRERHIVAMRRGSNNAVSLPADFII